MKRTAKRDSSRLVGGAAVLAIGSIVAKVLDLGVSQVWGAADICGKQVTLVGNALGLQLARKQVIILKGQAKIDRNGLDRHATVTSSRKLATFRNSSR